MADERIGRRIGLQTDLFEPHLTGGGLADGCVERPGEHLRSEAHAQERDLSVDGLQRQFADVLDERLLVGVFHVEGAAEEHDALNGVEVGTRHGAIQRVPYLYLGAGGRHGSGCDAEGVDLIAVDEQDPTHAPNIRVDRGDRATGGRDRVCVCGPSRRTGWPPR